MGFKRMQKSQGEDLPGETVAHRSMQEKPVKSTSSAEKVERDSRYNETYHTGRVVSTAGGFPIYEEKEGARARGKSKIVRENKERWERSR